MQRENIDTLDSVQEGVLGYLKSDLNALKK